MTGSWKNASGVLESPRNFCNQENGNHVRSYATAAFMYIRMCYSEADEDECVIVVYTAGYVWAYNAQIYYQGIGTDDQTIAWYMSWIPLVFGCVGVSLGGFISDRVVRRVGPYARLGVLIASQVCFVLIRVLVSEIRHKGSAACLSL